MKYYVTADIHGFYTPLITALTEAGYFTDTEPHKLVILGDLLDRGTEAVKVQDFILDLMSRDEVILIRGNHEDLLEELVMYDHGLPNEMHRHNGTYNTALQLTGWDMAMAMVRNNDFVDAIMGTPFYAKVLPAMLDYYETKSYIFVHGWIPTIVERDRTHSYVTNWRKSSERDWKSARWTNGMFAAQTATDDDKTVVCGHWHTSFGHATYEQKGSEFGDDADFSPYYGSGVIALDACTAHTGKVNVICLND